MSPFLKHARRRAEIRRAARDDGFTLAEAIVSIALFTIAGAAAFIATLALLKITWLTTVKVTATGLARDELEKLRIMNAATSTPTFPTSEPPIYLHNTKFTVTPSVGNCLASTATGNVSQVERIVTVTVQAQGDSRTVKLNSVLTC